METVRLAIVIHIDQCDDDYDTELTVEQWNALTDAERSSLYQGVWEAMAQHDDGGVAVLTEGAVSL